MDQNPFKIDAFDAEISKKISESPKIGYPPSEGVALGGRCYPPSDSEWGVFYPHFGLLTPHWGGSTYPYTSLGSKIFEIPEIYI